MTTHQKIDSAALEKLMRLPEPDASNITVLTQKLSGSPILPWNHYDSPWLEPEAEESLNGHQNGTGARGSDSESAHLADETNSAEPE